MAEEVKNIDANLIEWMATQTDKKVKSYQDGYYHINVVIEAYNEGKKKSEDEQLAELRKNFFSQFNDIVSTTTSFIKLLKQEGYTVSKLFINPSLSSSKVLMAISEKVHNSDKFIDFAYPKIVEIKKQYMAKDINLSMSFIDDSKHLDISVLKSDGFDLAIDTVKNEVIG